jgi:hypothetical protein
MQYSPAYCYFQSQKRNIEGHNRLNAIKYIIKFMSMFHFNTILTLHFLTLGHSFVLYLNCSSPNL